VTTPVLSQDPTRLLTEERRLAIVRMLSARGSVTSEELGEHFAVSHMTVYRDLKALEGQGLLRCVRGGAVRVAEAASPEPRLAAKRLLNRPEKKAVAALAAAEFVQDGDILILEAGSTVAEMIPHLSAHRGLTVITNGLETSRAASTLLPNIDLMCCGGMLREASHTFVGPHAERFFAEVRAKTLFLGTSAINLTDGITDPNPLEIAVKRAMAASAERVVLLADSSKFGKRSLTPILPLSRLHAVLTDDGASPEDLAALRAEGLTVRTASVN
jgi:DeoR/GlpR family transcriptional regulator of sugar metabolism